MTDINVGAISEALNNKVDLPQGKTQADIRQVVEVSPKNILPSWYRVYSDGWCEQGGVITGTAITYYTVSLIKSYSNTNYTVTVADHCDSNNTGGYSTGIDEKTTTSFTHRGINIATTFCNTFDWQASGYIS